MTCLIVCVTHIEECTAALTNSHVSIDTVAQLWETKLMCGCSPSGAQRCHHRHRGVRQLPGVHDHPRRVPHPGGAPAHHEGPGERQGERDGLGRLGTHNHRQPHGGKNTSLSKLLFLLNAVVVLTLPTVGQLRFFSAIFFLYAPIVR